MDDAKVHAIAVGGSTGEGHTLEHDELRQLCEVAIDAAGGRIPVVGSIIVDSTREAIQKAKMLDEVGARRSADHAGPLPVQAFRRRHG